MQGRFWPAAVFGLPPVTTDVPVMTTGASITIIGPPTVATGAPTTTTDAPVVTAGASIIIIGPPMVATGAPTTTTDAPVVTAGVVVMAAGLVFATSGVGSGTQTRGSGTPGAICGDFEGCAARAGRGSGRWKDRTRADVGRVHGCSSTHEVRHERTDRSSFFAVRTQHIRVRTRRGCVMSVIPDGRSEAIDWFTNRLAAWTADPTSIGLTAELVSELAAATSEASAARAAAQQAEIDKLAASQTFRNKADAMRTKGVGCVQQVRGFAKATNDPAVYAAALLPDPADPQPTPAPGVPYGFKVSLNQDGWVELTFKCDNPGAQGGTVGGVTYDVWRQDEPQTPFNYILNTGERRFEDNTVPAGTAIATYRVVARRSTQVGDPALYPVRFGVGANGQAVVDAA